MAANTQIAVQMTFATLPEGFKGTPQAFLTWMSENAIFTASGAFLTGQIGGARPVSNVGIFVNGTSIEVWSGGTSGKYVPLSTMPIGAVLDYAMPGLVPPDNYLFCEGQLLLGTDYPELFSAIGKFYNITGDDPAKFRMPDYRSRVSVGAGDTQGVFNPSDPTTIPGLLSLRPFGTYFGAEWPIYLQTYPPNSPSKRYSATIQGVSTTKTGSVKTPFVWSKGTFNSVMPPSIAVRKIMRCR